MVTFAMSSAAAQQAERSATYVGAAACRNCHKLAWNSWSESAHARMVRPFASDPIAAMVRKAGAAPIPLDKVDLVVGTMHQLAFVQKRDGQLLVLGHQFDLDRRVWAPLALAHTGAPEAGTTPGGENAANASGEIDWKARCAGCHTTGFEPATGHFTQYSVSCESCHGPGSQHVAAKGKGGIVNPAKIPHAQGRHVCAQCHARGHDREAGTPFPAHYRPGDDLDATFVYDDPVPGQNSELFWGNGMARAHHAQYNELRQSKHFVKGVRCLDCHESHRERNKEPTANLRLIAMTERVLTRRRTHFVCLRCHADGTLGAKVVATRDGRMLDGHSHHPQKIKKPRVPGAAGRPMIERMYCWECHMPKQVRADVGYRTRAHTFKPPDPLGTVSFGAENGCTQCHTDQPADWAANKVATWRAAKPAKDESAIGTP